MTRFSMIAFTIVPYIYIDICDSRGSTQKEIDEITSIERKRILERNKMPVG